MCRVYWVGVFMGEPRAYTEAQSNIRAGRVGPGQVKPFEALARPFNNRAVPKLDWAELSICACVG